MTLTERLMEVANLGAEWVLWLLLGLSLISVMVILERAAFFFRLRAAVEPMRQRLLEFLLRGEYEKARTHFGEQRSMEAQVLAAGLAAHDMGHVAAGELMTGALATERVRYERNLGFLATVGSNTPFVGLFGTVLGIINAFAALDLSGGTEVDNRIMAAIAEALIATGVGLLVAIPAVVAFNMYRVRVKRSVANTEKLVRTLVAHLVAERENGEAVTRTPVGSGAAGPMDGRPARSKGRKKGKDAAEKSGEASGGADASGEAEDSAVATQKTIVAGA